MLTPAYLARLEENMKVISENAYAGALKNQWASKIMKEIPSSASKEHLHFLITGGSYDYSTEGNVSFREQSSGRIDLEPKFVSADGLRLLKSELDDSDGAGFSKAADWSSKVAVQIALWPQRKLAAALLNPTMTYDGVSLFSTSHPLMYGDTSVGVFANDFTSTASGLYPGAVPITGAFDTANANIGKVVAYIRAILAPDGVTPRGLEPKYLICGPGLYRAALIATRSSFIGGTAGSTDMQAVMNDFNLEVIMSPELGADTNYYIACEPVGSEVGSFIFCNREPGTIAYHGPMTSAELARKRVYEWTVAGRAVVAPAKPEFIFRCKAT